MPSEGAAALDVQVPAFGAMVPVTAGEIFQAICIVPGPAVTVAKLAAFKTFFVDAAHMKDAKGETVHDSAQFVIIEMKTSLMEVATDKDGRRYVTKNLPLAVSICLAESKDEYAFAYYIVARAGFDLNSKEFNIVHDRGKAVIAAKDKAIPQADNFFCDQHVFRNVAALPGVGKLDNIRADFLAMTKAPTANGFEEARAGLCSKLPANAVEYIMALEPEKINAYWFRRKTGKAISFTNSNPVEMENGRMMSARWAKHPVEALLEMMKTWGSTFADHQQLIRRELAGASPNDMPIIFPVVKRRAMGQWKMAEALKLTCDRRLECGRRPSYDERIAR